jgi:hypothetical protein
MAFPARSTHRLLGHFGALLIYLVFSDYDSTHFFATHLARRFSAGAHHNTPT